MNRLAVLYTILLLLAACAPGATMDSRGNGSSWTVPEGPYQGCVVVNGGWAIDCDYAPIEWGEGTPSPALPAEPPRPLPEDPPLVPPYMPAPDPLPQPEPTPDPTPDPVPNPDPTPNLEPDPAPTPDCKPGWGYGDKNHCHDGPPGRSQ